MAYQTITVETRGAIAEIRLERPVLDARVLDEIDRAAAAISDDDAVMVALLTAVGDAFCSGWDASQPRPALPHGALAFRSLELMAQPVIACIEGEALGAGLELALACDVRIASETASFAMTQVAAGEVPSLGGTQRLPRLVGRGKASSMILLGERVDARAALACGLVNEVVPARGVRARAEELAASIAAQGSIAVRYAKEAIRQGLDMPLEQALRYETDLTIILQTTADRAEGVQAFLEKRKPRFTGS
ncbi:MAG: enoyl-CoA hydratase/isomerase family protein [Chloroflexi bacterium]|nr:enoyl-CoA hydratase/isomerase family protein [Chloroflexota bacterium]